MQLNIPAKNVVGMVEGTDPKLKNEYYSPKKIKKILDKINKLTTKKDLQFINSELVETIKNDKLLVRINVSEGQKYYVERVNIIGNSITDDNVIRGELIVDEGDPYSLLLLDKSINNLKARNLFGRVDKTTYEGSSPDLKMINIEVEEKATGEIFAGAGVEPAQWQIPRCAKAVGAEIGRLSPPLRVRAFSPV